jgi:hypothetical protein
VLSTNCTPSDWRMDARRGECNLQIDEPHTHIFEVLPFVEEEDILNMCTKPRGYLPSLSSDNFCRQARKRRVTTFVIRV